jgi:hypothetical protein
LKQPASGGEGNRTTNVRTTLLEYAQITCTSRQKSTLMPDLTAKFTQASGDHGYLMMKRTAMRCRSNCSGQAWPGQAIGAVLPRGSFRRVFEAPISSPDTMTARWEHRDPPAASRTLIASGRFRSSSEIEPTIDTHSYPTPQGLSPNPSLDDRRGGHP